MVLRESSNERKHEFLQYQQKPNMSLNICHEENTKKIDSFLVDNKPEPWNDSEPSAVVPKKIVDYEYFNLMTLFLVSLVISLVGYWFKIFRISWYKCMTPFIDHLHWVMNKYLCSFRKLLPGIDNILNEEPLSGMSKYIMFSLTLMFVKFGHYFCC